MTNRERFLTAALIVSLIVNGVLIHAAWIMWLARQPIAIGPVAALPAADEPVWHTKSMPISTTGYQASVGPWVYERDPGRAPSKYSISVEQPYEGGSHPLYHKDLRVDELPAGFAEKPIEEIVGYEPETRLVTFRLGDRVYEFRLPEPKE